MKATFSFPGISFRSHILALILTILAITPSGLLIADDNDDLTIKIAALIGTHNVALPISFVPDPVLGIPASAVTFGTNLGLKDTKAVFVTPDDWEAWPNSADGCEFQFELPQSTASYSNLLGFITLDNVPGAWGELTRTGQVQVVHANTGVNVHARNPHILPDWLESQAVGFPSGQHAIDWRAETQISDAFDIIIPASLLLFNSIQYGTAVANQGWSAARQAASQNAARQVIQNIAQETGLVTASQLFEGRTSVVHERDQTITIWKQVRPELSTTQPSLTLEATDFGGVLYQRVRDQLRATIEASDPCGKPFTLGNDSGPLLNIGSNALTWTIRDSGPLPGGGFNSDSLIQQISIQDTQGPILVPPPSLVIEVPAGETGLLASQVALGAARVVDLADPNPMIDNDSPGFYPINSRSPITWTATDASGNSSQDDQLITVKAEGSNTPPSVSDVSASTLTSEPIEIVLSGQDVDFIDGQFDPLSFRISERPDNGEFVAPLYPFFIEDYRTSPGGPYGEDFYLSGNRSAWLKANVCDVLSGPNRDKIEIDWVYEPEFVVVDDRGMVFMQDRYWECSSSGAGSAPRISSWDREGNFIGQIQYEGANQAFVLDRDGFLYEFKTVGSGSSREIVLNRCATDFVDKANRPDFCESLGSVDNDSAPNLSSSSVSYARIDSNQGLLYITDKERVFVFDVRNDPPDPIYLATLNADDPFDVPNPSCAGSSLLGYAMDVDSEGNLYMANCANQRIEKFTASRFDEQGQFIAGDYVGWMGRCESSTNNACDESKNISRGFACTDATCTRTPSSNDWAGEDPGQFDTPLYIAIDPNDVLYVAEWDNFRVQRFAPDGTFAGQAISTGSGINQGEQPGFILGNMGRPRAVSVNSTQFYVVDREEGFVHVFETSPLKDITDDSATVTYVSNSDFHTDVDSFQFVANDGLHDSNVGTAQINVARNFRAPVADDQTVDTLESQAIEITLAADDPDGILGSDFNGLDVLSFTVIEPPSNGTLTLIASNNDSQAVRFTPTPGFFGSDRFSFIANDGVDDSNLAEVTIEVAFVDDAPVINEFDLPERVSLGFPTVSRATFEDDGAEDLTAWIDWDGDVFDEGRINEDDPDNPFIEELLFIEPTLGKGIGYGISQYVFDTAGSKDIEFCVADQSERIECSSLTILAEPLVNLGIELPDDQGQTPPAQIPIGDSFNFDVEVSNLLPEGFAGMVAQAVSMQGTIETPGITFTGSSEGNCTISPDGQSIDCDFGNFNPGEQRTVTLTFATDPIVDDGTIANIRLRFTTQSDAVNEITEAYITRIIFDPNLIFSDRFQAP